MQAPFIAGVHEWETRTWLPTGELPDWLDELGAKHLEAFERFERDTNDTIELRAANERAARDWRRKVREAVAVGGEPPEPINTALADATLAVTQEDAVSSPEELGRVAVAILAVLRSRRADLAPYLADCSEPLRYAILRGPEGMVVHATELLE
jgi:hypothetical protein